MAEMERIARLYGLLPPIDPALMEAPPVPEMPMPPQPLVGNAIPSPPPLSGQALFPGLQRPAPISPSSLPMPGRVPPSARPVPARSLEEMLMQPAPAAPEPTVFPAPPPVPPEVDPSNEPRTQAEDPRARGTRGPQTREENWWTQMLDRVVMAGPRGADARAEQWAAPLREMNAEEGGRRLGQRTASREEELPVPPEFVENVNQPAAPEDQARAVEGVSRTRYAPFTGQLPNNSEALEAYRASAPKPRYEDPENRLMRLIAGALAGAGPGEYGPLGAISGLANAYARETERDTALGDRDDTARREFQRGLGQVLMTAGQNDFANQMAVAGFNQRGEIAGDELQVRREANQIAGQNAALSRMLTTMRIQALARQSGMEAEPSNILARGLPAAIRAGALTSLTTTDAEGRTGQLMIPVPPEYLPQQRGQAATQPQNMTAAQARRAVTERLGRDPAYMGQPQALRDAVNEVLSQSALVAIMGLPEPQRSSLMRNLIPFIETRPRAGSTSLAED